MSDTSSDYLQVDTSSGTTNLVDFNQYCWGCTCNLNCCCGCCTQTWSINVTDPDEYYVVVSKVDVDSVDIVTVLAGYIDASIYRVIKGYVIFRVPRLPSLVMWQEEGLPIIEIATSGSNAKRFVESHFSE